MEHSKLKIFYCMIGILLITDYWFILLSFLWTLWTLILIKWKRIYTVQFLFHELWNIISCTTLKLYHNVMPFIRVSFFCIFNIKYIYCVFKKNILWMKTIHYPNKKLFPVGHNHTNGAVYSKINLKVMICSAH